MIYGQVNDNMYRGVILQKAHHPTTDGAPILIGVTGTGSVGSYQVKPRLLAATMEDG